MSGRCAGQSSLGRSIRTRLESLKTAVASYLVAAQRAPLSSLHLTSATARPNVLSVSPPLATGGGGVSAPARGLMRAASSSLCSHMSAPRLPPSRCTASNRPRVSVSTVAATRARTQRSPRERTLKQSPIREHPLAVGSSGTGGAGATEEADPML